MSARQLVERLLLENPEAFEDYVVQNVPTATIERWLRRKTHMSEMQRQLQPQEPLYRLRSSIDPAAFVQAVLNAIETHPVFDQAVWELGYCVGVAIGSDGFNVYLQREQNPDKIFILVGSVNDKPVRQVKLLEENVNIKGLFSQKIKKPCRKTKEFEPTDEDQPKHNKREPKFSLFFPIETHNPEKYFIVELYRDKNQFFEEDEAMAESYMVWGNITLHYVKLSQEMRRQETINECILNFARSIFQDIENEDILIVKIMKYAQELVRADRASLFLVDQKNRELYATIFDLGNDKGSDENSSSNVEEIRFPIGKGIAGFVAQTGETLNITDAYNDDRFNSSVDLKTGYKTHSILCMPINSRGQIIGVVQMVNKCNGPFTTSDVEAFKVFAVYCGLALHNSKLYTRIKRSESKYRVAMDVLSYHNTCTSDEVRAGLSDLDSFSIAVDHFYFDPNHLTSYQKVLNVVQMFIDLFDLVDFNKTCLVRFVLTVKKNYRRLPYHNWTHGYSVCNTMYNIIKRSNGIFTRNECLALFIGALCHDLDHRGKNNKFMLETESPLASMYSTSTMEHHHFNQTVMVLNQEDHNIFVKLPNDDYKEVLKILKHCILATDLALFFPNRDRLFKLIAADEFSWDIPEHRTYATAVAMTASDLSASSKPWTIQASTVDVIFKEFYEQGDAEREAGRIPMPMMDRNRPEELPASQVGFLQIICEPCMKLLTELLPKTSDLYRGCEENLRRWMKIKIDVQNFIKKQINAPEVENYMKHLIEAETDLYYQRTDGSYFNSTFDADYQNPSTSKSGNEEACTKIIAKSQKEVKDAGKSILKPSNSGKEKVAKKDNRSDRIKKSRNRDKHVVFADPLALTIEPQLLSDLIDPPETVLLEPISQSLQRKPKYSTTQARVQRRVSPPARQIFLVKPQTDGKTSEQFKKGK